jgi:hypothetical protein
VTFSIAFQKNYGIMFNIATEKDTGGIKNNRRSTMKTKFLLFSLAIIFSGVLILSSSAFAIKWNPGCVAGAKTEFKNCTADCKEAFQVAKDSCRKVDHECAEKCREEYDGDGESQVVGCVTPFLESRAAELAVCQAALETAKAICRQNNPDPGQARDTCIDNAQVSAFICRDTVREKFQPDLAKCRATFKACIKACPAP